MEINPSVFFELGKSISNLNETHCIIDVFIEISKNSHIKYEYDKEKKALICDRILHTPFTYSFNYGFVPDTLSEDNDPLDVIVLINEELIPGSYIKCKILGYLETKDDEEKDNFNPPPKSESAGVQKTIPQDQKSQKEQMMNMTSNNDSTFRTIGKTPEPNYEDKTNLDLNDYKNYGGKKTCGPCSNKNI